VVGVFSTSLLAGVTPERAVALRYPTRLRTSRVLVANHASVQVAPHTRQRYRVPFGEICTGAHGTPVHLYAAQPHGAKFTQSYENTTRPFFLIGCFTNCNALTRALPARFTDGRQSWSIR
jgi:hypothetical protein